MIAELIADAEELQKNDYEANLLKAVKNLVDGSVQDAQNDIEVCISSMFIL